MFYHDLLVVFTVSICVCVWDILAFKFRFVQVLYSPATCIYENWPRIFVTVQIYSHGGATPWNYSVYPSTSGTAPTEAANICKPRRQKENIRRDPTLIFYCHGKVHYYTIHMFVRCGMYFSLQDKCWVQEVSEKLLPVYEQSIWTVEQWKTNFLSLFSSFYVSSI